MSSDLKLDKSHTQALNHQSDITQEVPQGKQHLLNPKSQLSAKTNSCTSAYTLAPLQGMM
jgi:hypothetical protein